MTADFVCTIEEVKEPVDAEVESRGRELAVPYQSSSSIHILRSTSINSALGRRWKRPAGSDVRALLLNAACGSTAGIFLLIGLTWFQHIDVADRPNPTRVLWSDAQIVINVNEKSLEGSGVSVK